MVWQWNSHLAYSIATEARPRSPAAERSSKGRTGQ